MEPPVAIEIPKWYLTLLNNLYEIEKKISLYGDPGNAAKNIQKIKDACREEALFFYEDPLAQPFKETRTDLEATIPGEAPRIWL